jgi:hypothetical protein
MFSFGDLFQWERFITPSIIKVFYFLVVLTALLVALSGIVAGARLYLADPVGGSFAIAVSLVGAITGIVLARILSEFVLILFRINEHLGAIRNRGGM